MTVRSTLFKSHILPAITYASESWNTTQNVEFSLRTTQRGIDRRISKVSKREHFNGIGIRRRTGIEVEV